jgi:hypothetical protein
MIRWLIPFLVLAFVSDALADEFDAGIHVAAGSNHNSAAHATISAGIDVDVAVVSPVHLPGQMFEIGLSYDRVQLHNGVTGDFRWRLPFFACYGWEYRCLGKRFWLVAIPSLGERLGGGGLNAFAATQVQAVFDLSRGDACCRFAVGIQHRFPFNSSLHNDNAVTLEIRLPVGFRDPARRPPEQAPRH